MWLPEAWEQYKAAREALANTTGSTEVILSLQELTFSAGEAGCRRDRRSCALSDVPAGRCEIAENIQHNAGRSAHGRSCHGGDLAGLGAKDPLRCEREQRCSPMAASSYGST